MATCASAVAIKIQAYSFEAIWLVSTCWVGSYNNNYLSQTLGKVNKKLLSLLNNEILYNMKLFMIITRNSNLYTANVINYSVLISIKLCFNPVEKYWLEKKNFSANQTNLVIAYESESESE